jgi:hypothetical protein
MARKKGDLVIFKIGRQFFLKIISTFSVAIVSRAVSGPLENSK